MVENNSSSSSTVLATTAAVGTAGLVIGYFVGKYDVVGAVSAEVGKLGLPGFLQSKPKRRKRGVRVIRVGTRKSELAMIQTNHIVKLIKDKYPDIAVRVITPIDAIGDVNLSFHLRYLATRTPGLFTKDLEGGLLHDCYDVAVHSLKDMPTTLPEGLSLCAITEREDPRDAMVFRKDLQELLLQTKRKTDPNASLDISDLPPKSIIGTSSVRREAMLRHLFPDKHFEYRIIRGNVGTRLKKLDSGEYDATLLAVSGLKRLGSEYSDRITIELDPATYFYGVSQGALGLECRSEDDDLIKILKDATGHRATSLRCEAERSVLRTLEGGCQLPLGVFSVYNPQTSVLKIGAKMLDEHGERTSVAEFERVVETEEAAVVFGRDIANHLLQHGGLEILKTMKNFAEVDGKNISRPLTYGSAAEPNLAARPNA